LPPQTEEPGATMTQVTYYDRDLHPWALRNARLLRLAEEFVTTNRLGRVGVAHFGRLVGIEIRHRGDSLLRAQLRQAQAVVAAHIQEIEDAWHRHFGR
jgi:hypothetical protein